jgi:hypothetical protein
MIDLNRYTDTRDENWIIDEHPDHPNLYFATGGSGHAFKVGPFKHLLYRVCLPHANRVLP